MTAPSQPPSQTGFGVRSLPHADGSLYSTVGDLATREEALHSGKLIKAASLTAMFTDWGGGYGFGEVIGKTFGHPRYFHSGGINGFVGELDYYPAENLTVAVLTNQTNTAPTRSPQTSLPPTSRPRPARLNWTTHGR